MVTMLIFISTNPIFYPHEASGYSLSLPNRIIDAVFLFVQLEVGVKMEYGFDAFRGRTVAERVGKTDCVVYRRTSCSPAFAGSSA
jgi:hypothetical protein